MIARHEKGLEPGGCIKSIKSSWLNGGVGSNSDASKSSRAVDGCNSVSVIGTGMSKVSCSKGDVVPPRGPLYGSSKDRSASSRRGYMSRVR